MTEKIEHPNITLGTAGHIDHGKTALIKLLTGCDTDRLKEEKDRGMSIDLGFAPCMISNMQVGIVDVPGHENFIKTMVAGASGMDGVIFVVAADDGIMPQTREHFEILTLLGIKYGIVALTKIDRVDAEHIEIVTADIEDYFSGTFLEGAPILPLSNTTGEGYDPFYMALMDLVKSITPKNPDGLFRLPVERTFSVKGYGTVLSGIPVSGSATVGDEIELVPQNEKYRINGIQVYNRKSDTVVAGQCAALNIRHLDQQSVGRGDIVTVPGYFSPTKWYVCSLTMLSRGGFFLKNGSRVKFHTGTTEVTARIYPMYGNRIQSGDETIVQMRLDKPLAAGPGDHFILRAHSPITTVGGGTIVEGIPRKLKRTHPGVIDDIEKRAAAISNESSFVEYAVRTTQQFATSESDLSHRVKLPLSMVAGIISRLMDEEKIILLTGKLYMHIDTLAILEKNVLDTLTEHHKEFPESPGMSDKQLLEELKLPRNVLDSVIRVLGNSGKIVKTKDVVSLHGHRAEFNEQDRKLIDAIETLYKDRLFSPPILDEIIEKTGIPRNDVGRTLKLLIDHKRLVRVSDKHLFHADAVSRASQLLSDHFSSEERLESVKFKYLLDTSRKYAIPLLDYMDKTGVTRRVGNTRYSNLPKKS